MTKSLLGRMDLVTRCGRPFCSFALGWDDTLQCIQIMHASRWCTRSNILRRWSNMSPWQEELVSRCGRPFCSLHWVAITHSSAYNCTVHAHEPQIQMMHKILRKHCISALHCPQMHGKSFDGFTFMLHSGLKWGPGRCKVKYHSYEYRWPSGISSVRLP